MPPTPEHILSEEEIMSSMVGPDLPWLSPLTDPVTIAEALSKEFELDWVYWEPETLKTTIQDKLFVKLQDEIWEKILAIRNVIRVDYFWEKWEVFEKVCCAFNNIQPKFDVIQYLSLGQMAYTIDCVNTLRKHKFNDEVKSYIAARMADEGLVVAPRSLSFCQLELDKLTPNTSDLKEAIKNFNVSGENNPDNPIYVQKMVIMAIDQFVNYNVDKRKKELSQLKD